MATEKQIHVRLNEYNNLSSPSVKDKDICISIDDIVWVEDEGSQRILLYERNRSNGDIATLKVQETLQDILNDADNSGYTEHGLKQATLLKFNNIKRDSTSIIFNRGGQRVEHMEPVDAADTDLLDEGTGTFIRYRSKNHKYPDQFWVSEDLCGVTEPSAS